MTQTTIPQSVLTDFENRTVVSVTDLVWVDEAHTALTAKVPFAELEGFGPIPFATSADADTAHGREIWNNAISGAYSDIAAYVPPTAQQRREMMPDLEKWRVDTIIGLESGLREKINAALDKWPEPKRTIAKNKLNSVTHFRRTDTLFDDIGADPDVGKSPEDIDAMWLAGASLT
ncbi:hypothetical protein IB024_04910 [Brucella sp. 6810]|uniref:hypothetical protein n=1 Tax=Brucella sp. 6810 TaxID=2769351 RepID=UPI00165B8720|nr:hypothetical protein [Brucella sp. 6810]QNQ63087.1 hypothetical protein IB024_04910 [Brucella sp. 6810]